jgi:hypothetical protein
MAITGCSSQTRTATPSPTSTTIIEPVQTSNIFYVGDTPSGFKLFSESYPVSGSDKNSLTHLISDLVSGKAQPLDPDYSNLWGTDTSLLSIKLVASLATVDLHLGKLNVGSEAEMRAIDQIFWTIARFNSTVTMMNLLVDGSKVESLAGHVDATNTFLLEPAFDVLNALQISSIHEGEKLVAPLIVTGEACTFEANVAWKLFQDAIVVKTGAVTAAEACPTRSKWTLNLGQLAPGNYKLLVQDFSAKDGAMIAEDSKNFEVVKG